jgi:uncharacterized protein (DUF1919 family)
MMWIRKIKRLFIAVSFVAYYQVLVVRLAISGLIFRSRLTNKDFSIVSNDCWGGQVYKALQLKYKTPFVGLMLMSPCYIKMIRKLRFYLSQELTFTEKSRYQNIEGMRAKYHMTYPIGLLNNEIEVHFFHYGSAEEARSKWTRRIQYFNWNNVFIKYDATKDLATVEDLMQFDDLLYPKVSFGFKDQPTITSYVKVTHWSFDAVKAYAVTHRFFDVIGWLNGRKGNVGLLGWLLYFLVHAVADRRLYNRALILRFFKIAKS